MGTDHPRIRRRGGLNGTANSTRARLPSLLKAAQRGRLVVTAPHARRPGTSAPAVPAFIVAQPGN